MSEMGRGDNMENSYTKLTIMVAVILAAAIPTLLLSQQSAEGVVPIDTVQRKAAPMATFGDNVYIA
jgi:hypothetical protein